MAQAAPYVRQQNFTNWQTNNPGVDFNGTDLDAEFNAVATALNGTITNLNLIQRADGFLANQSVGTDQIAASVLRLFAAGTGIVRGQWSSGAVYAVRDIVFVAPITYLCLVAHTAGTFATDLAAGDWAALSEGVPGPSITKALNMIRLKADGSAYEYRTATNVLADLSLPPLITTLPDPSTGDGVTVNFVGLNAAKTAYVARTATQARGDLGVNNGVAVEAIGQGLEDDGAGNLRVKLDVAAAGGGVGASGLARSVNGVRVDPSFLRGFIDGFETSASGANNIMTFSPGACVDSTNAFLIKSTTAAFTKTLASWVAGNGNGGLDTGATGGAINTPYFGHVIFNPTTGAVDFILSLSSTAPTLPAGFTIFRCLTWGKTDGSKNFLQFQQRGDEFLYGAELIDVNTTPGVTTAVLATLTVPSGFQVMARLRIRLNGGASGGPGALYTSPDETDQTPSATVTSQAAPTSGAVGGEFLVRTNTSAQIRYRLSATDASLVVQTYGFFWTRGRNI